MPLDSSRLASRIRDVVRGGRRRPLTSDEVRPIDDHDVPGGPASGPHYVIDPDTDAVWNAPGGCAVVERHYDLDFWHGRQSVRDYFETLEQGRRWFSVLGARGQAMVTGRPRAGFDWEETEPTDIERAAAPKPSGPLLFFDLETTGLSGGAGTVAFLVGCGHFDADGFHTKQFFLSGYEAEHDLLISLGALLKDFGGLVTFNGRAFDVPLIETRYLFHRLESPFDGVPHFDMLHPARRLWRRRSSRFGEPDTWAPATAADNESCALCALEEAILGVRREGDVPGFEIPSRYFHYLRTGDGAGLEAVFEHNRLDVLSLAAITSVAARMVEQGPSGALTPRDALALGHVFERAGQGESAVACYGLAAGLGDAPWESRSIETGLRAEALRRLAVMHRRHRRYGDAAEAWNHLVEMEASHAYRAEAIRALAIHHEHRAKDLVRARTYAERALEVEHEPGEADALRHRLSRLDRKLQQRGQR